MAASDTLRALALPLAAIVIALLSLLSIHIDGVRRLHRVDRG